MSLKPITTERKIRRFFTYDLEWIPGTLQVRIVGFYDGDRYRCYHSVDAFLNAQLSSANRGAWFYAHAGGLADVQFVLHAIVRAVKVGDSRYRVSAAFSGSSAIIVKITRGKNCWHFVDSYWLFRDRLANIGKFMGMPKGGPDDDFSQLSEIEYQKKQEEIKQWYATVPIAELRDYNEQDCKILWYAINEFENTLLSFGGQLQMTIASCGMQLFRRKYLTEEIRTSAAINSFARDAYVGSRVEVIQRHTQDAFYYDINSSFPYAMTQPCPGEYIGAGNRLPDSDHFPYIADVEIEIPDMYLPPLPFRTQMGRIFFPTGKWRAHLSNVDIELLQECEGTVHKVYECLLFHPFDDLRAYATDIYNERKKSTDPFRRIVFKYLLNCLYGKFAERSDKQSLHINPSESWFAKYAANPKLPRPEMLFPGAFLEQREIPVPHMHVPISMHITALARRKIYHLMADCEEVHYCDTDGFSTTEEMSTTNELGGLKLEKLIKDGLFVAPKMYRIRGQELKPGPSGQVWEDIDLVRAKGFSRLNVDRFLKILEGETIEYERMVRIRENFRRGHFSPREIIVPKRVNVESFIPKRFTYPDGTTRAWEKKEIEKL